MKPANAKLVHKKTERHLKNCLIGVIPNAVPTGITAVSSLIIREIKSGI